MALRLPPAAAVLLLAAGCQLNPAQLHPRFAELRPTAVAVMPVVNRTVTDLSDVRTAGALQRLILGGHGLDVPSTLRDALLDGLLEKGYQARLDEGAAGGGAGGAQAGAAGFDAVLHSTITDFNQEAGPQPAAMELTGSVELIRLGQPTDGGGEVLYRSTFHHRSLARGTTGGTAVELSEGVRRAGLGALSSLPRRDGPAAAGAGPAAADPAGVPVSGTGVEARS